jgi:hypothetical protein
MGKIKLPRAGGELFEYRYGNGVLFEKPSVPLKSRVVFSAAHVVNDPLADTDPLHASKIHWEDTMAYRRHLWSLGLGVAEAMDTAQRGMGLSWEHAKELIARSTKEASQCGGLVACGAGTDHLAPHPGLTLQEVIAAYEEQCEFVESHGGQIILMASRALAACAKGPEDYEQVYDRILEQVSRPVILHWLGDMFDPALAGYWGYRYDLDAGMDVCLNIIRKHSSKVDGIKISLLDADKEIKMRRLLPSDAKMYTGDDFNYPMLIKGDGQGYSHALLGIFDAIAPAAAAAINALDEGDMSRYDLILDKTVPLSRHIFQAPTYAYKTGIVFMAYLNGHQSHFRMIGGAESSRSVIHLSDLFVLADQAGLLTEPDMAADRMKLVLRLAGVG